MTIKPAAWGVLLALLAIICAFFVTGLGHGWVAPFYCSLGLPLVYPAVLLRRRAPAPQWIAPDAAIVVLAIAADVWLVLDSIRRADGPRWPGELLLPGVDASVMPLFALWLILWLYWQIVAVRTLWQDLARRRETKPA